MDFEKLEKYNLFIGLNDKDLKKQVIKTSKAKTIISQICGDCTMSDCVGTYTHNDGTRIKENTIKVELLFKSEPEVIDYCNILKQVLNQESIAVSQEIVKSALI